MKHSFLLVLLATLLLVQSSLQCEGSPTNFCLKVESNGDMYVDRGSGLELRPTLNLVVGNTYNFTLLTSSPYQCLFSHNSLPSFRFSNGLTKITLDYNGDQTLFTPSSSFPFTLRLQCYNLHTYSILVNVATNATCTTCVGTRTNICMSCLRITNQYGVVHFDRGNGYEIMTETSPFRLNTSVLYTFVHDGDTSMSNCKFEYHGRQGEGSWGPNPPPAWVTGNYPLTVKGTKFYVYTEQPATYGDIQSPSNPSLIVSEGGDTHPIRDPLPLCPSASPMPGPMSSPAPKPVATPLKSLIPAASPTRSPKPAPGASAMKSPSPMESREEGTSASNSIHSAARFVSLLAMLVLAFSL